MRARELYGNRALLQFLLYTDVRTRLTELALASLTLNLCVSTHTLHASKQAPGGGQRACMRTGARLRTRPVRTE